MKAMQQIKAVIIARGEVQRVGYRDIVERAARKMKLTGIVENIKPYDVKIICEGNKISIDSFIRLIDIKESPIEVEELEVSFEDATGEFDYFEIKRGDMTEELSERLDIANSNMKQMIEKQDVMIEKQDVMIEKIEDNTSILKDFKSETNRNFTQLTNIMTKHDVDAQERIAALTVEVSDIKARLVRVESALV
jgi:acylphosphatase